MRKQKKAGRPPLGEHIKKKRKALRCYIKTAELHVEIMREAGMDFIDYSAVKTGRPSLSSGEKYDRAKHAFNQAMQELHKYEKSQGFKLSDISDVKNSEDPVVDKNKGKITTGRPKRDELAELDYKIRYLNRQIARVESESDVELDAGRGRPRAQRSERLANFKTEKERVIKELQEKERGLEGVSRASRNLKRARDAVRLKKIEIKNALDVEKIKLNLELEQLEKTVVKQNHELKIESKRAELREGIQEVENRISEETDSSLVAMYLSDKKTLELKLNRYDYQASFDAYDEYLKAKNA